MLTLVVALGYYPTAQIHPVRLKQAYLSQLQKLEKSVTPAKAGVRKLLKTGFPLS